MTADEELGRLLSRYGIAAASGCAQRFRIYLALLEKWNRRINLVSSTSWKILGPLLEEGVWAGKSYPRGPARHLDIGSGAGFPALPMRLVSEDMKLRMVESSGRKAAFLETAAEALGLCDVRVCNCRLETYLREVGAADEWDCVSWKALILSRSSFSALAARARSGALFWVFHGEKLPVEGGEPDSSLHLLRREQIPGKPSWRLSVFEKRPV